MPPARQTDEGSGCRSKRGKPPRTGRGEGDEAPGSISPLCTFVARERLLRLQIPECTAAVRHSRPAGKELRSAADQVGAGRAPRAKAGALWVAGAGCSTRGCPLLPGGRGAGEGVPAPLGRRCLGQPAPLAGTMRLTRLLAMAEKLTPPWAPEMGRAGRAGRSKKPAAAAPILEEDWQVFRGDTVSWGPGVGRQAPPGHPDRTVFFPPPRRCRS